MSHISLTLTDDEAAEINLPANGSGGLQSLIRSLQKLLQEDGSIQLNDAQVGKIIRYIGYGQGGMEKRLERAFRRSFNALMDRA